MNKKKVIVTGLSVLGSLSYALNKYDFNKPYKEKASDFIKQKMNKKRSNIKRKKK